MNRSASALLWVFLLGTTATLAGALGAFLMLLAVIGAYGVCMAPLRSRLTGSAAWLASVVLAAALASCAEILAQRWFLPWQQTFALYAGLIAWQCLMLEHTGFFRQPLAECFKRCALFGALMLGFAVLRELIGHGSLAVGLTEHWHGLVFFGDGLHVATLVPGALILAGLLLAARQAWTRSNSISKETHRP
jgi:electron transport complex protein RnfE